MNAPKIVLSPGNPMLRNTCILLRETLKSHATRQILLDGVDAVWSVEG